MCVADRHRDGRLVGIGFPVLVDHLDDGAQRAIGDDALRAAGNGLDHRGLLSVPSSEGTESEGVAHPEHIVAIALGLLFLRGVELGLLQFEALLELAVEVERLALVEVDADAVVLAFEVDTVMVLDVIGVGTVAAGRDRLDEVVVLVLLLDLIVAQQHLGIDTCRIGDRLRCRIVFDRQDRCLPGFQVEQHTELVVDAILIEVVELAGDFLLAQHDFGRMDIGIAPFVFDHDRDIRAIDIGRVLHFITGVHRLGKSGCRESSHQCQ